MNVISKIDIRKCLLLLDINLYLKLVLNLRKKYTPAMFLIFLHFFVINLTYKSFIGSCNCEKKYKIWFYKKY